MMKQRSNMLAGQSISANAHTCNCIWRKLKKNIISLNQCRCIYIHFLYWTIRWTNTISREWERRISQGGKIAAFRWCGMAVNAKVAYFILDGKWSRIVHTFPKNRKNIKKKLKSVYCLEIFKKFVTWLNIDIRFATKWFKPMWKIEEITQFKKNETPDAEGTIFFLFRP